MVADETGAAPSIPAVQAVIDGGTFEEALSALEMVVAHLERGKLSIDESVTWYELGRGLSRRCTDLLQQAELRISTIEERYAITPRDRERWEAE